MEQRPLAEKRGNAVGAVGVPVKEDVLDALEALSCECWLIYVLSSHI